MHRRLEQRPVPVGGVPDQVVLDAQVVAGRLQTEVVPDRDDREVDRCSASTAIATTAAGSQGTRATARPRRRGRRRRARAVARAAGAAPPARRASAPAAHSPNADASTANVSSRGPVQSCQWKQQRHERRQAQRRQPARHPFDGVEAGGAPRDRTAQAAPNGERRRPRAMWPTTTCARRPAACCCRRRSAGGRARARNQSAERRPTRPRRSESARARGARPA